MGELLFVKGECGSGEPFSEVILTTDCTDFRLIIDESDGAEAVLAKKSV